MFYAVILAGGGGTRLWPVSRKSFPKQVQPFIDNDTLLQKTYSRINQGFEPDKIFIAAGKSQKDLIKEQLPFVDDTHFYLEPCKCDTAAAIGLAAFSLNKLDPESVMVTINSDHYIQDEAEYLRIIKLAEKIIADNPKQTVLIGVKPTYPETGYGYIQLTDQYQNYGQDQVFQVERFVEKPDLETAKKYLESGKYLWNPAVFVWKTSYLIELFAQHLPVHHEKLRKIVNKQGAPDYYKFFAEEFCSLKPISIDYGIMEKLESMLVIPAVFGWADIGHWKSVKEVLSNSVDENLTKGHVICLDSKNNLIYNFSDKLISVTGLENMVVVQTEDALLICPLDKAQDVKKIVNEIKDQKQEKFL